MKVIGLDISSTCTGVAVFNDGQLIAWHKWVLPKGKPHAQRLDMLRRKLSHLFITHNPQAVVVEDVYSGPNPKTQKVLSLYHGVAYQLCWQLLGCAPQVISEGEIRSRVGKANRVKLTGKGAKRKVFDWVVGAYGLVGFQFASDNDITDAVATALAYWC